MLVDQRDMHLATARQYLRAANPGKPATDDNYVL
jgi:hypothetical protein